MWGEAKPFPTEEGGFSLLTIAFKEQLAVPSYFEEQLAVPSRKVTDPLARRSQTRL